MAVNRCALTGRGAIVVFFVLMVLISVAGTGAGKAHGVWRDVGSITPLEGGLGPAPNGTAVRMDPMNDGPRALVWGHEGPSDLRLVDVDLVTIGVLPMPSPVFHVGGASLSDSGERALVWGSEGGRSNDALLSYNLTSFEQDAGYLPGGLFGLATVDYARLYAWELILVVAGRSANGTSELVFVETTPMQVLSRAPLPGNASVQYLGTDGHSMYCLLVDGTAVVISTRDWTVVRTMGAVEGPFTAWHISKLAVYLAGADGTVFTWDEHRAGGGAVMRLDGSVRGLCMAQSETNKTPVVAFAPPDGDQLVRGFTVSDILNWTQVVEAALSGANLTMLQPHPSAPDVVWACFDDGSVRPYEVRIWREFEDVEGTKGYFRPDVTAASLALIAAIVIVAVRLRRARKAGRRGGEGPT